MHKEQAKTYSWVYFYVTLVFCQAKMEIQYTSNNLQDQVMSQAVEIS